MNIEALDGFADLFGVRLERRPIDLSRARIARLLGYRKNVPEYLSEAIDRICSDLAQRSRPLGGFRLCSAVVSEDRLRCAGEDFATGPGIAEQLQQVQRLAIFTATVGDGYEQLRHEYSDQDDPLVLYVLDAAGSEMAERVADRVQRAIRGAAQVAGMAISNRYSPGYCGWNVAEQHRLLSLLPPGFCGITLSPSAMMRPIKSVSGIVGLGKEIKHSAYRCDLCTMRDTCHGRSRFPRNTSAAAVP